MSLGNGNPKDGDKGSNFNYELKVLQGLQAIAVALETNNHVSLKYTDLYALYNAGALVPGRFYTITNFAVVYNVPLYNMIGEPYYDYEGMPVRYPGGYSLTVQAFTNELLYPSAFSKERPGIYFEYDITANTTAFGNEDTRGKITRYVNTSTGNSGYTDLDYVQYGRFSTYVSTGSSLTGTNFTVNYNDGSGTGHIECVDANANFIAEVAVGGIYNLGNDYGNDYGNVYVEQVLNDNYLIFTAETGINDTFTIARLYNAELLDVLSWKETYIGQYERDGFYDYYTSVDPSCANITLGKYNFNNSFQLDNNIIGFNGGYGCINITFGSGSQNNTIKGGNHINALNADGNYFGNSCSNIVLTGPTVENIFVTGPIDLYSSGTMYKNIILSDFSSNNIAGRFFFNTLRTSFSYNTINCSSGFVNNSFDFEFNFNSIICRDFSNNTGYTFSRNVILSGPVVNNSFDKFTGNTINSNREGFGHNNFGKNTNFNYFLDFNSNEFGITECMSNTFQCAVSAQDFSSATLIADNYSKTVMQAPGAAAPTLWYLDATNTPQYDVVTA